MMEVPATLLAAFPPSAELLLDRARSQTDDAMLMEIAATDYGWMAEEMMAELRFIRDKGVVPVPLPRMLSEVLSLTQFSNPDAPNAPPFQNGSTSRHGHQTRLFACAVLLRAEADPKGREGKDRCAIESQEPSVVMTAGGHASLGARSGRSRGRPPGDDGCRAYG